MLPARRALLALAVTAGLGGCGGEPAERRTASTTPVTTPEYPVAYAVARSDLPALAREPLPDALEDAKVVATSKWDPYALVVLLEWLRERRIDLETLPALEDEADAISRAWDVPVLLIAAGHARSYGRRLARVRADRAELREYAEAFSEEELPEAGLAMERWLTIVKQAVSRVDERRVVVIPLTE
jgi:hypothetical protein